MAAYGQFLRGLLSDPHAVSAPTPSSPALSAAIAAKVDISRPGMVLELGPGTGVVTEALLARGLAPERLLTIESCGYFADLLRRRLPDVGVIEGDAFAFEQHLPHGAKIAAIVSGIPLLLFPAARRRALIERALTIQGAGGKFIQLSYGWLPPIKPMDGMRVRRTVVWRNFPPAHIWTFTAEPALSRSRRAVPKTPSHATAW